MNYQNMLKLPNSAFQTSTVNSNFFRHKWLTNTRINTQQSGLKFTHRRPLSTKEKEKMKKMKGRRTEKKRELAGGRRRLRRSNAHILPARGNSRPDYKPRPHRYHLLDYTTVPRPLSTSRSTRRYGVVRYCIPLKTSIHIIIMTLNRNWSALVRSLSPKQSVHATRLAQVSS